MGLVGGKQAAITGALEWPLRVTVPSGRRARDIMAGVGTGAFYTALPARWLRELGVEPFAERRFFSAGARYTYADIGEARATINGRTVPTLVAFADDDTPAVIGTYTLDGLGLTLDPVAQRLVPKHFIMYRTTAAHGAS